MKYTVTFNIFGKTMRVKVRAHSAVEAKRKTIDKILSRISFINIKPDNDPPDMPDVFKDIFNI